MKYSEYVPGMRNRTYYISADVARFGSDKSVVIVWQGWRMVKIYAGEKQSTNITRDAIEGLAAQFGVSRSNIVIDEDGIGGGIVDQLPGVQGFVNNSRAYEVAPTPKILKHNFANLKTQCYFKLSEFVNDGKISCVDDIREEMKKLIIEDLEQIKVKMSTTSDQVIKEGKLEIIPKDQIFERLRRSPDHGDAMMMRMLFIQQF